MLCRTAVGNTTLLSHDFIVERADYTFDKNDIFVYIHSCQIITKAKI